MSLLPFLMNPILDSYNYEQYDQWQLRNRLRSNLGSGITPQEIHILENLPSVRSSRQQLRDQSDRLGEPQVGKDGFQVLMDVQQFRPNEITVKTVDNTVIIEGKHEERQDEHGSISRHFLRKYQLPKGYDAKDVVSTLSSDGILSIKAPTPQKSGSERVIQIQQTGPAHLNIKDNSAGAGDEKNKAGDEKNKSAGKKNGNLF